MQLLRPLPFQALQVGLWLGIFEQAVVVVEVLESLEPLQAGAFGVLWGFFGLFGVDAGSLRVVFSLLQLVLLRLPLTVKLALFLIVRGILGAVALR